MKVLVFNRQKDLSILAASVKAVVKEVLKAENLLTDEVSIYFVSSHEISFLHQQFFNDPTCTDCISFPMDEIDEQESGYHVLGDVFICPQMAIEYTGQARENVYEEITLYLVHGLLHLIGYDDIKLKDRNAMRKAEARHLEQLLDKKLLLKGTSCV